MSGETIRQRGEGWVSEPSPQTEWQQPVAPMPSGLTIRVRAIECMLADIQAQIQTLRQEMTYLGLVRGELVGGMEAK